MVPLACRYYHCPPFTQGYSGRTYCDAKSCGTTTSYIPYSQTPDSNGRFKYTGSIPACVSCDYASAVPDGGRLVRSDVCVRNLYWDAPTHGDYTYLIQNPPYNVTKYKTEPRLGWVATWTVTQRPGFDQKYIDSWLVESSENYPFLSTDWWRVTNAMLDKTGIYADGYTPASRGVEAADDLYHVVYCRGLGGMYSFDSGYKSFKQCVIPRHTGAAQPVWADNQDTYQWTPAAGFVRSNAASGWRTCPRYGNTDGTYFDGDVPTYNCAPIPGAHSCSMGGVVPLADSISYEAVPLVGPAQWEASKSVTTTVTKTTGLITTKTVVVKLYPGVLRFSYNSSSWPSGVNYGRRVAIIALVRLGIAAGGDVFALSNTTCKTSSQTTTSTSYAQGRLVAGSGDGTIYGTVQARYSNGDMMPLLDGTAKEGWPGSIDVVATSRAQTSAQFAALIMAETSSFAFDIAW